MDEDIPAHYEYAAQPIVDRMRQHTRNWTVDAARDYPIHRDEWRPLSVFGDETPDQQKHATVIDAYCSIITSVITMEVMTNRQPAGRHSLAQQQLATLNGYQITAQLSPRTGGVWLTVRFKQRLPTLQIIDRQAKAFAKPSQIIASHTRPTSWVCCDDVMSVYGSDLVEERKTMTKLPVGSPWYVPYLN